MTYREPYRRKLKRDRACYWPGWGEYKRTVHRDARIEVLVTAEEKTAIKALAKQARRDVSTWIRDILRREISSTPLSSGPKPQASK